MIDEVRHWIETGRDHFEGARILLDKGYPTDVVGLLLQQALEAYLRGLLLSWEIDPEGDEGLESLISAVIQKDRAFEGFRDLCVRVSGYYVFGQLPPDPLSSQAQEEMRNSLSQAQELIARIEGQVA